jgi:protease I
VQSLARAYFAAKKPVAAICHGVLVVGRAKLLSGKKTTSLTNALELAAYRMTKLWLKDYYRTYAQTTEDEVRSYLASPADYAEGPMAIRRDTPEHPERGFVVRDEHYLSARWPGDAHRFAFTLAEMLEGK